MQNNNDEGQYEILFDEWQRCLDQDPFPDENKKPEVLLLPVCVY